MTRNRLAAMACVVALWIAGAVSASAQTFTTLWAFDSNEGNGPVGVGALIQGLTTGTIEVRTRSGATLSSNVPFAVLP